ncbi:MAG: sigma-54-dependent Fis family transcriptional regulator [Candidatus Krumholzibacteriota bacterium]|nr:sigma-54-dependent Fis family transcriptional regulator [Candidatus Krumholzibacteriota bacterium]
MRLLVDRLRRAARTPLPVLLTGETGVGKELLARLVHEQSGRAGEPFVPANMAAIPGDLFESVLFGHVRGAFTGAAGDAAGLAEAVGKGTLFLDEIGDLPPALQGKLLRFLDTGEYLPLGGRTARRSAGRIVAATNRDLGQLVAEGLFRADLYHRLDVFGFRVPPLRERRGDIVPIARWTLEEAAGRCDFGELELGEGARAVIERYDWPGNVRELRNELFRAATLAGGGTLRAGHFSERLLCGVFAAAEGSAGGLRERLEQAERREIAAALAAAAGNRSRAAALLGLKRTTLIYRIKRLGIGEG